MSTAAQIGLRRAYRPSIVSLNGRVLAIGRSVFAHGPSAAIIRNSARLGSYKSLGNSAARQPPAATMPTSMGNNRGSDGIISSEPFEQIRSNLRPALKKRLPPPDHGRPIAKGRRPRSRRGETGEPAAPSSTASPVHVGNAARRPIGNSAHEVQRRSHSMLRSEGRTRFGLGRCHSLGFVRSAAGRKQRRQLGKSRRSMTGGSHSKAPIATAFVRSQA